MQSISTNSLILGCEIYKNENSLQRNLKDIRTICDSVKTSYGPLGLDKMCVSASGDVMITNDGASILKSMLLNSSSAQLLVNLALEQDKEVGDGTTTVVLLATFLIENGYELIRSGIHPSTVVTGYRLAYNESVRYIKDKMTHKCDNDKCDKLIMDGLIRTAISSKIINEESELFLEIINKCIKKNVSDIDDNISNNINNISNNINNNLKLSFTDSINIIKSIGGSMSDTAYYNGFLLNCSLASPMMEEFVSEANFSILLLDFSLNIIKLPITASISARPDEIEAIRKKEIDLTVDRCNKLIESKFNLILVTGGIDELYVKKFVEKRIIAVKRVSKYDLEKISKCSGIEILKSFEGVNNESDNVSNNSMHVSDNSMHAFNNQSNNISKSTSKNNSILGSLINFQDSFSCLLLNIPSSTILLKGPNYQVVEEMERSLNDAIQIVKRSLKSKHILPGGGAVESTLFFVLEEFCSKMHLKEHVAIHRYSEALLQLVKTLCTNSGLDSGKLINQLLKLQKSSGFTNGKFKGLDVIKGTIQSNLEYGIIEPTIYKLKALKAATEAAISILRINETIIFK